MHETAVLLGVWMKGKPIHMKHPDAHFVNWLTDKGWDVQRLSGTEEYRAFPPEEERDEFLDLFLEKEAK